MAVFVYRRALSTGAMELAEALGGRRWRDRIMPLSQKVRAGDTVICWGEAFPATPGVRVLNGAPLTNKFTDAQVIAAAGVSTIEVNRTRPTAPAAGPIVDPAVALWNAATEAAEDFINDEIGDIITRNAPRVAGINDLTQRLIALQTAMARPIPTATPIPAANWIGRDANHVGGADLLNPTTAPDYWAKKETFTAEFRVHSFNGRSIRAGKKEHRIDPEWTRSGRTPSDWVRSWDGGWRIVYDGVSSKQRHRDIAHAAIAALGLQFGAVDIGERADRSLVVLEVNRAPGLDGGTIPCYATAITGWMNGTPAAAAA